MFSYTFLLKTNAIYCVRKIIKNFLGDKNMINNNEAPSTPVNQPIQMHFPVTPENQINHGAPIAPPDIHEERRQAALVAREQRNFVNRPMIRLTLNLPKPPASATLNPNCKEEVFRSNNYPNGGGSSSLCV